MGTNRSRQPGTWASQVVLVAKNLPANARDAKDAGSVSGLGRPPAAGKGNPLQYSCLENFMDRSLVGYCPWGPTESDTTAYCTLHSSRQAQGSR